MTPNSNPSRIIVSRNDSRIKRIRNLQHREERMRTGLFYVEGTQFLAEAVRFHAQVETIVVCPELLSTPFGRKLIRKQQESRIPILHVTPEVMHSLAQIDDPQGIGAVVRQKWLPLERVKVGGKLCWLACDSIQSPGNLGSILRTSDAVGGAGLILLGDATDPYDSAAVRATMGAIFSQRFVRTTIRKFARWKAERQWLLVGTSPRSRVDYRTVRYDEPTVLLIGSERKGLSDESLQSCDAVVRIPMVGHADSLNVAVATGVVLYELFNQRRGVQTPSVRSP